MNRHARLVVLGFFLMGGSGCRQPEAHSQAPHELPTLAVTRFTDKTELFAEHPVLVAGHEAPIAAHVTDLRDFSPLREGSLQAILTDSQGDRQVFQVEGVLRPGIFRPVVKPREAGTYQLSFHVSSPTLTDRIAAGPVTVYADDQQARQAAPEGTENPDEIAFLMEQQWKIPFMTQPVKTNSLREGVALPATIKPAGQREAIVSAPTGGRLAYPRRPLVMGDQVHKDQELAVVSPATESGGDQPLLEQAVAVAEAKVRQAKLDLERTQRLFQAQAIPGKRVEEAQTALAIAEAERTSARQRLSAKKILLSGKGTLAERYRVLAPLTGVVVDSPVVAGSTVTTGALLFRIIDLGVVWAEAKVPEVDLARVMGNTQAEVRLPGSTAVHQGHLVTTGHVLDPISRTTPVVFAVKNPIGTFKIGMTAEVRIMTGSTAPGPVIPTSALVDDNGKAIAFVQTGGESFERRDLKLGVKQAGQVQVLAGLKAGERVVTQGGYEIYLSTVTNAVPAHGHDH